MTTTPTHPPVPPTAPRPPSSGPWTIGRVIAVVTAALVLMLGTLLAVTGAGMAATSAVLRDDDGFFTSTPSTWESPGHAVRSENVSLHRGPMMPNLSGRMTGTVEVTARATTGDDVFVGIARSSDVDRYLRGVAASTMVDPWDEDGPRAYFTDGGSPRVAPDEVPIWVASASGSGSERIDWDPRSGDWTLVVMNADGTTPVSAEVTLAAELPIVNVAGVTLIVSGLILLVLSGVGLWLAVPRTRPTTKE
ncbi:MULTISPECIES: hypothetical protein [unclassified Nocardioides]|uniref:hypothetical protein n=1 Tax=unclassified Nocardioides TaxID=2615069 RepID=UPI0036216CE5